MGNGRLEAGMRNFICWAEVHFRWYNWSMLSISLVLGLSVGLIMLWLGDILSWLAHNSLSNDRLRYNCAFGQNWSVTMHGGLSINGRLSVSSVLNISGRLCIWKFISIVNNSRIVFSDTWMWCVNSLWYLRNSSMSWANNILLRCSMLVMTIDWRCVYMMIGLMLVAWNGILMLRFIAVIASNCWLCNISLWLRVRNGLCERLRRRWLSISHRCWIRQRLFSNDPSISHSQGSTQCNKLRKINKLKLIQSPTNLE